jgi:hypothetical protein
MSLQLRLERQVGLEWDVELVRKENGKYDLVWADTADMDLSQRIKYYLRTFRGEYELDTCLGLPYLDLFFVKGTDIGTIKSTIKNYIARRIEEDTNYIIEEISCNLESYDSESRVLNIFLYVKTKETEASIYEVF